MPEGFAVLTDAYLAFVRHNHLEEAVRELVEEPPDPHVLIRDTLRLCGAMIWIIPVAVMRSGRMAETALRRKVKDWLGDETLLTPVQRALPHNITTEMGLRFGGWHGSSRSRVPALI